MDPIFISFRKCDFHRIAFRKLPSDIQAHPSTFTGRLGRKESVEDFVSAVFRYSRAAIQDSERIGRSVNTEAYNWHNFFRRRQQLKPIDRVGNKVLHDLQNLSADRMDEHRRLAKTGCVDADLMTLKLRPMQTA
nr:hypothetical protein [Burkholderia pseudomallei]